MKIAFLAGRNAVHTVRWVNALVERGNEVHLITLHPAGDEVDARVALHLLPFGGRIGYFLNASRVRRILQDIEPDLLNVHYASGYGTLGRLCGFHPAVLSVWGSDVYDFPEKSFLHRGQVVRNLRSSDHICSTSKVMAERTRSLLLEECRISVTPFGVETDLFAPRKVEDAADCITVGTVKKLGSKYGIDILIRAFALLTGKGSKRDPDLAHRLRLLIVGEGPERTALEKLTQDLGIASQCEFAGSVPHREVPSLLNRLNVYVAVSRLDSESFGVAVLEASACGLPVVVSDVGGLPEVVIEGETGLVVERENPEATASALEELVFDDEMRKKMGEAGRNHVIRNYEWTACVRRMERVYEKVVSEDVVANPHR